jgi:hypothetical protein
MVVVINGFKGGISWTNFIFCTQSPEVAFDRLSAYVADGLVLINAWLIDGSVRLALPVEAFDGQPFGLPIKQLQQQWEHILGEKPDWITSMNRQRYKEWDRLLIAYYENQIGYFSKAIDRVEKAARISETLRYSPKRFRLTQQYETLVQRYTLQLNAILMTYQITIDHLNRLEL